MPVASFSQRGGVGKYDMYDDDDDDDSAAESSAAGGERMSMLLRVGGARRRIRIQATVAARATKAAAAEKEQETQKKANKKNKRKAESCKWWTTLLVACRELRPEVCREVEAACSPTPSICSSPHRRQRQRQRQLQHGLAGAARDATAAWCCLAEAPPRRQSRQKEAFALARALKSLLSGPSRTSRCRCRSSASRLDFSSCLSSVVVLVLLALLVLLVLLVAVAAEVAAGWGVAPVRGIKSASRSNVVLVDAPRATAAAAATRFPPTSPPPPPDRRQA